MAVTTLFNITSPTVNIKKDHPTEPCILLETKTASNDVLTLHFDNVDDMNAYVSILKLTVDEHYAQQRKVQ